MWKGIVAEFTDMRIPSGSYKRETRGEEGDRVQNHAGVGPGSLHCHKKVWASILWLPICPQKVLSKEMIGHSYEIGWPCLYCQVSEAQGTMFSGHQSSVTTQSPPHFHFLVWYLLNSHSFSLHQAPQAFPVSDRQGKGSPVEAVSTEL